MPFGANSTIQDLEDFIVSNNILPLGSLVYLLFCVTKYGWGWKNFSEEANAGKEFNLQIDEKICYIYSSADRYFYIYTGLH